MPKRILEGVVVSDKNNKTVVVKVERRLTHPVLRKTVRLTKNYHAHDEKNEAKIGDTVRIEETRPMSKLKRWLLVEKVASGVGNEVAAKP
jgi:small subunit ribosomal protein S17